MTKDCFVLGQQIKCFLRKMEGHAQTAGYCTVLNFLGARLFISYVVLVWPAMHC